MSAADARALWESGVERELNWWSACLASRGRDDPQDFLARFDPDTPLQPAIVNVLTRYERNADPIILDCAAGPATTLGKTLNRQRLHLVAIDALANLYAEILARLQITPPVPSRQCEVEQLQDMFAEDQFDLVYMRFALDHVYDPARAVQQMARVCRPGGAIMIEHYLDEHVDEYQGLKQWGLHPGDGDLLIVNARETYSIREILPQWTLQVDTEPNWVTVTAYKPLDAGG